jgi:peptidoglycan/LPS O-acetylase OafA/YrhL
LPRVQEPDWPLLRAACAAIARYSYSIYLIHVPCIWLGFDVLRDEPAFLKWSVFVGTLAGVSILLYRLVERPFIGFGARLGRRWTERTRGGADTIRA